MSFNISNSREIFYSIFEHYKLIENIILNENYDSYLDFNDFSKIFTPGRSYSTIIPLKNNISRISEENTIHTLDKKIKMKICIDIIGKIINPLGEILEKLLSHHSSIEQYKDAHHDTADFLPNLKFFNKLAGDMNQQQKYLHELLYKICSGTHKYVISEDEENYVDYIFLDYNEIKPKISLDDSIVEELTNYMTVDIMDTEIYFFNPSLYETIRNSDNLTESFIRSLITNVNIDTVDFTLDQLKLNKSDIIQTSNNRTYIDNLTKTMGYYEAANIERSDSEKEAIRNFRAKWIESFTNGYFVNKMSFDSIEIFDTNPQIILQEAIEVEKRKKIITQIMSIDIFFPIYQKENHIIAGNRQTGKTSIAIDIILNQKKKNDSVNEENKIYCIYVSIGKSKLEISRIKKLLKENGAMEYTTILLASSSDTYGMQYLALYSGYKIGEYLRDKGKNALIIYDDITQHVLASKLINTNFTENIILQEYKKLFRKTYIKSNKDITSGSITTISILETDNGDFSKFIPSNIISIADQLIYLEKNFEFMTSINLSLSHSKQKSNGIEEYDVIEEFFADFKNQIDIHTQKKISIKSNNIRTKIRTRSKILNDLLQQPKNTPYTIEVQVILIYIFINGYLDYNIDLIKKIKKYLLDPNNKELVKIKNLIQNKDTPLKDMKREIRIFLNNIQF